MEKAFFCLFAQPADREVHFYSNSISVNIFLGQYYSMVEKPIFDPRCGSFTRVLHKYFLIFGFREALQSRIDEGKIHNFRASYQTSKGRLDLLHVVIETIPSPKWGFRRINEELMKIAFSFPLHFWDYQSIRKRVSRKNPNWNLQANRSCLRDLQKESWEQQTSPFSLSVTIFDNWLENSFAFTVWVDLGEIYETFGMRSNDKLNNKMRSSG